MKMRQFLVGINVLGILLFFLCSNKLTSFQYRTEDMVLLNDKYQQVMEALDAGRDRQLVMEEYGCEIIEFNDENYTAKLYQAISEKDTVFDYLKGQTLISKIIFKQNDAMFEQVKKEIRGILLLFVGGMLLLIDGLSLYQYVRIIKPFHGLKEFAGNIAKGELDAPLHMNKHNYFGAFTESFDVMREELNKAREGEYQANLSKRELVASLSHDIKTPVASIKALCEILEIKLKDNKNVSKIYSIDTKAGEIEQLIGNLFHATLEELTVLKIIPEEEESTIIPQMLEDMNHYGLIKQIGEIPECLIYCDRLRLNQVLDNIISNSYKYAKTKIEVSYEETEQNIIMEIRDFGTSLSDMDLLLVCEKFYRGENSAGKSGSGLGLYLAKTFMEQMGGGLSCENDHGFVVTLHIQKIGAELRNR